MKKYLNYAAVIVATLALVLALVAFVKASQEPVYAPNLLDAYTQDDRGTGLLTAVSAAIGGGFGSTGCTLSATGTLQCDGATTLGSTLVVTGTSDLVGNVADSGGTFTIADDASVTGTLAVTGATTLSSGGTSAFDFTVTNTSLNGGAKNEFIGLNRLKLVALGEMKNGSVETTNYIDDTPDGEWTAITTTVTVSADTSIYRIGSKSLKLAFGATAADDQGATIDITNDDLEANESIGFWIYSDTVLDAGDLDILIDDTDADPDSTFNVCAVATINTWQWCEVDISGLTGGTGNVVDKVGIVLKDAANLAAFNVNFDAMWKWDADHEIALGNAILTDGVYSVINIATAQDAANTPGGPSENTQYFVHYESGNDFLVAITDMSAASGMALIAY